MNSRVLVDRELLELAYNAVHALMGMDIDGFTAERCKELRHLLATPAPIPDDGELERLVTEQVRHAYYELKTITEAVGEIVSALQASAMVVPDDSLRLDWLMHNLGGYALNAIGVLTSGNCCREEIDAAMLAAAPAPGDSQ